MTLVCRLIGVGSENHYGKGLHGKIMLEDKIIVDRIFKDFQKTLSFSRSVAKLNHKALVICGDLAIFVR